MVRGKIARRLLFLFLVVALLPLILLGIRFDIDVDVLTIYAFYAVFITMIVALFLLRGIVGPIKRLTEGTMRLAGGDLDYRVSIPSEDEFGQLARSFNDMASSLKEKQEALRVSADYLKTVLDNLPDEVVVVDRHYRITDVNAATVLIEGYKRKEEIIGRHCYEVLHRSEIPCTEFRGTCPVRTVFETGGSAMTVHLHYDRYDRGHYVEIGASPIKDSEGNIIAVIEVLRDITEKKEKEEKILRQNRELMALNSISAIALITRNKEEILGHTLERILEVTELDAGWISLLTKTGDGISLVAHKGISDDFVSEESKPSLCGCICEDVFVTGEPVSAEMLECKRVRKELIEKEGLRRHISVPMRTKEGVIGMMNLASRHERIFTPEEVSFFVLIANTTATALENVNLYRSLSDRYIDLSQIHEAGMALIGELDLERLYKTISEWALELIGAETIAIPMIEPDKSIKYVYALGRLASEMKDQSGKSIVGRLCEWVIKNDKAAIVKDALKDDRADKELARRMGVRTILVIPLRSEGRIIGGISALNKKGDGVFDDHDLRLLTIFGNQAAVAIENAKLYRELKEKMDELKNSQDQLIRSAKLAAIGELAANIAHEINNPLTGVLGYATLLLSSPETSPSQKAMLEVIENETIRARATVRNLLDFSRPKPLMKEKRNIIDALEGAVTLLRKLLEIANVELIKGYAEELPSVEIDMDQMKQVFLNLLNNALQSMPKGGILTLRTSYRKPEDVIIVEIIDTGSGVSEENLERIFDPFFTTKEGEGAGLGLSISYRILEGHGGRIEAESEIGKGSIFRVILPRAKDGR
jgi:PAS domain S-box-containing protein